MTSDDRRPSTTAPGPGAPGQAEVLRWIALHQETAALLKQRAHRRAGLRP